MSLRFRSWWCGLVSKFVCSGRTVFYKSLVMAVLNFEPRLLMMAFCMLLAFVMKPFLRSRRNCLWILTTNLEIVSRSFVFCEKGWLGSTGVGKVTAWLATTFLRLVQRHRIPGHHKGFWQGICAHTCQWRTSLGQESQWVCTGCVGGSGRHSIGDDLF